jgi:hypothetical protein
MLTALGATFYYDIQDCKKLDCWNPSHVEESVRLHQIVTSELTCPSCPCPDFHCPGAEIDYNEHQISDPVILLESFLRRRRRELQKEEQLLLSNNNGQCNNSGVGDRYKKQYEDLQRWTDTVNSVQLVLKAMRLRTPLTAFFTR